MKSQNMHLKIEKLPKISFRTQCTCIITKADIFINTSLKFTLLNIIRWHDKGRSLRSGRGSMAMQWLNMPHDTLAFFKWKYLSPFISFLIFYRLLSNLIGTIENFSHAFLFHLPGPRPVSALWRQSIVHFLKIMAQKNSTMAKIIS